MDTDDGLAWLERQVHAAVVGEASALCKLSIAVGVAEVATTARTGRHIPTASTLESKANAGAAAFDAHAQQLAAPALAAAATAPGDSATTARAAVKVLIADLLSCVATGAAMPRDALHRQHLSAWADWRLAGGQKRGLKLDCAGLTLAVYALAQTLAPRVPALAAIATTVAEDHCWISVDGTGARAAAAEVASEDPAQRGEPPGEGVWRCFLYSAGHATVCTRAQAVAAVVASMDTCVGEKRSEESEVARSVQRALFEALVATGGAAALYPNARCTLAEVRQDGVLDAAREAAPQGADAVAAELRGLRGPFLDMLDVVGAVPAAADDKHAQAAPREALRAGPGPEDGNVAAGGTAGAVNGAAASQQAAKDHAAQGSGVHVRLRDTETLRGASGDYAGTDGVRNSSSNAQGGAALTAGEQAPVAAPADSSNGVGSASRPTTDATSAVALKQTMGGTCVRADLWPEPHTISCPLTVGNVRLPRRANGAWRWYPSWFAAMYLWDTAEVLAEEFAGALGQAAVATEVQGLAVLALRIMATGALARYRFHKHDEQLCKTLDQLSDSAVDFFQWQAAQPDLPEDRQFAAFHAYVAFVDHLACYYAPVGIPGKLIAAALKICRLQSANVRYQAAAGQAWEAASLRGSEAVWRDLKPALRVMLESAWAPDAEEAGENGVKGGRTRKRAKR